MIYLKKFETQTAYETAESGLILPNVSLITENNKVHYNPYAEPVETRVVAKFNVTNTSSPTQIISEYADSPFSAIEIDGVVQPSVVSTYTFSTTGEHTVKYTLTDPTSIYFAAFALCYSLTSIDIPNSVTIIGDLAFTDCNGLTSAIIGSGVTSINGNAFANCISLTRLNSDVDGVFNIPNSVTSIGGAAFQNCRSLTSINIPSGVTTIEGQVFYVCSGLTSIVIPSGVTSIGNNVFYGCYGLTSIVCDATTAPTIQSNTFSDVKRGGTLTVPSGSSGYDVWMGTGNYYLGKYNWTKVEQ